MNAEDGPGTSVQFPHCDSRVLHAPGECEYCDAQPGWQAYRIGAGICFTGHLPENDFETACPADHKRPPGSGDDHRRWGGNKPTAARGDPSWPAESSASIFLYGDQGGRGPWPLAERVLRRVRRPIVHFRLRRRGWHRDENGWWHFP